MAILSGPGVGEVADAVAADGWCVGRSFLDTGAVRELAAEARAAWEEGAFRRAGVGRGADWELRPEVRRDWVHWIEPEAASPAVARYLALVEELRREVNARTFLGLFAFEAHLTVYPPEAFYRRHLDRFRSAPWRTVSVILYLNEGWRPEDGGALRLELGEATVEAPSGDVVEVVPEAGTLVAFLADRFWHEVRPATRERMSLTGWLRTRG